MKTNPVTSFIYFVVSFIFSTAAFAQADSGGGSQCPISYSFKKNNGGGGCNGDAVVSVIFNPIPKSSDMPRLSAMYYKDEPITNLLPAPGILVTKNGETSISYCLVESGLKTSSIKNIAPAGKLILEFKYLDGTTCSTGNPN